MCVCVCVCVCLCVHVCVCVCVRGVCVCLCVCVFVCVCTWCVCVCVCVRGVCVVCCVWYVCTCMWVYLHSDISYMHTQHTFLSNDVISASKASLYYRGQSTPVEIYPYTVQEDLLARTLFWRLAICSIFRQYLKRQQNIYGY